MPRHSQRYLKNFKHSSTLKVSCTYLEEQETLMQPSWESKEVSNAGYFLPSASSQMLRKEKQVQQHLLPKPKIMAST